MSLLSSNLFAPPVSLQNSSSRPIYAANIFEESPTLQCVMNFTGRTRLSNQLGVAGIFMKETETAG
jgi:hypothetical protein